MKEQYTKNKKMIGILGGMGPLASAHLYQQIIAAAQQCYHAEQDTDFPPMMIYNLPLSGFDETGFSSPDLVKQQLIGGVQKLENAGCDFIVIACNTVHYFYEEMRSAISIPIISIIDETARGVKDSGHNTVGLLSSESTKKLQIYQKKLAAAEVKTVVVTDEQQKTLNKIILHVMSGLHDYNDKKLISTVIQDLCARGAESIVLGCTELPLTISQKDIKIPLFSSTEIIVKKALEYALE